MSTPVRNQGTSSRRGSVLKPRVVPFPSKTLLRPAVGRQRKWGQRRPLLGYVPWTLRPKTLPIFEDVKRIIFEVYNAFWPLAIRQVFYALTGLGYPKAESFYHKLVVMLGRARRARMIPWEALRDDTSSLMAGEWYASRDEFYRKMRRGAEGFTLDKQTFQRQYIEVHCEAAGVMAQVFRTVGEYSLPVRASGGFQSLDYKHALVQRAIDLYEKQLVVLYLGDWDPSGESMFANFAMDVQALLDGDEGKHPITPPLVFEKVVLTEAQVRRYAIPTAPPKKDDPRRKGWTETCQLEALPPDLLVDELKCAVQRYYDHGQYLEALAAEARERRHLLRDFRALPAPARR